MSTKRVSRKRTDSHTPRLFDYEEGGAEYVRHVTGDDDVDFDVRFDVNRFFDSDDAILQRY